MNFFTQLMALGLNEIHLEIKKSDDDRVTVLVVPKAAAKDKGLNAMKPLVLTATAEELDAEFFSTVETPLKETAGFFSNVTAYEVQKQEAEKQTQEKKDKASAEKKKETDAAAAKKKAEEGKDKALVKAETDLKKMDITNEDNIRKNKDKILKLADAVLALDAENKEAIDIKAKVEEVCKTPAVGETITFEFE